MKEAKELKLPSWPTLIKHLGPWDTWDKKFNFPYKTRVLRSEKVKKSSEEKLPEAKEKMREIPIKLLVPESIHGQVTITLQI